MKKLQAQAETSSSLSPYHRIALDEQKAVHVFHSTLATLGVSRSEAVAIWIGLKSKPGMILRTLSHNLADRVAFRIAQTMLDKDSHRFILIQGHPWWAHPGPYQAQQITMQGRLTSVRLRAFLVNAAMNGNREFMHIILIQGIGRAELYSYFTLIPRQLHALGGVLDLPWDSATSPTAVHENVFMMATVRQRLGVIDQPNILDFCTILTLQDPCTSSTSSELDRYFSSPLQHALSIHRAFNPFFARALIPAKHKSDALCVVGEALTLLDKNDVQPDPGLVKDAYMYLGHAWDLNHQGLFSKRVKTNVRLASDFWLTQSFIPRIWGEAKRRLPLQKDVERFFTDRYLKAEATWLHLLESRIH
ncbi:MAG: hypothetical protein GTO14_12990 [Anaerolineales bacterium]|nr:hypothetical protein [Anaerolineales bacterium]